jgi:ligand-binding sensor domain-containing protein
MVIAVLMLAAAWLQTRQCAAEDALRHDVLTTWTTEQGLPQNFIRSITQTSDGFLWVGTMNGLVRFNGLHFRGFGKDGPPELQGNIGGLVQDASDGLWVATATGLFHYTHHQFQPIPLEGQRHYRIEAMARTHDGEVWIYTDGKLTRSHNNVLETMSISPETLRVRDLAESSNNTLWIANGEAVLAFRGREKPVRYPLPGARMVYTDAFGGVFAGDGHRLFCFDGGAFQQVVHPGMGNFVSILVDHQQRLWMASGGLHGVSRKSTDEIQTLTVQDGLVSDDVRLIFEDRSHDVWLGTIAGLQRLHHGIFTTYPVPEGLSDERSPLDSVFQQKNGTIWAGSLEGGVVEQIDGHWRRFGHRQGLPAGQVRGFIEDGAMPSIAISDYGIFAFRGDRFFRIPSVPHGYISSPVRTPDGAAWFGVQHGGLYRSKGTQFARLGPADGLSDDAIWSLTVDAQGSLWVGAGNQLLRWNQSRFESILVSPSPILCIAWPQSGGLALGTLNGLLLRTSTKSRVLTQKEGLPGDTVLDVIEDPRGDLWIATTRAIARLSFTQWTAFAEGKVDNIHPEVYTSEDGLKSNTVLPLNQVTAIRAQDGKIWFPTARGLSVVDPRLEPEPAVPASVDSIMVDDQEQPPTDITVAPGRHRITFTYTTPPIIAPDQIRFRYRLSGWDNSWIEAGSAREVSYTALSPGSYTFEVMATNREGLTSNIPSMIHLRIRPFFWQARWFLALTIFVAAAILVEITRRRTRVNAERLSLRFQERAAERERIASEIHDTVIQDMIGTALQLELLGFQISDQPEQAASVLDSLTLRLRETIARSRNMVGNLHSTAVVQYSLVEVLRHAEAEFRLGDLPAFELISEGEPRPIHPLVRDEVYRICREALANAFRHSNARVVRVTVRFRRRYWRSRLAMMGKASMKRLEYTDGRDTLAFPVCTRMPNGSVLRLRFRAATTRARK